MASKKKRTRQFVQSVHQQPVVCKARHFDIARIFHLIEECSISGYFSTLFLVTPYQSGLALQLISAWLFGRIRLLPNNWCRATLRVIRHDGVFAGFILMRYLEPSGASQEIYMCALKTQYRGRGLGSQLIQSALESLDENCIVYALCVPQAVHMKHLLLRLGFKPVNPVKNNELQKFSLKISDLARP